MSDKIRPTIAAYVSGHGFGHYTRTSAVLASLATEVAIHVATSSRALALATADAWPASVRAVDVGPGVAQRGPLATDAPATRAALARHLADWPSLVDDEARWLRSIGADLVFADVPPLAFAAAARAGVPSLGMTNFSWSWIYDGYATPDTVDGVWFAAAARQLADAECEAGELLALEMGGGLEHFPRRTAIPPVARRPRLDRASARAALAFAVDERPIVLVSFGGFGAELDLAAAIARQIDLRSIVVGGPTAIAAPDVRCVHPDGTLGHPELVRAADCVLGKPGYSTVAECLTERTPMVHVPRGDFREAAPMIAALERWLPSARLSLEELAHGRWSTAVQRAIASRPPQIAPVPDGDTVARAIVRRTLGLPPSND